MTEFNIYCDESCHLENDGQPVMVLGCVKVKARKHDDLLRQMKQVQLKHCSPTEIKWNSVSASRLPMYRELIDVFFNESDVSFRCVLIKNKQYLNHDEFNQGEHDSFYYKLVYLLLNNEGFMGKIQPFSCRVFLDVKDTRGRERLNKTREVFTNKHAGKSPFSHFQHLSSIDSFWIQWADLLIGAVGYKARELNASATKVAIVQYLEQKLGYVLNDGTSPSEAKFNIFDFRVKVPTCEGSNV